MPVFYYPAGLLSSIFAWTPVIDRAAIPGGGGVTVCNFVGRGICTSISWAAGAAPVTVTVIRDGVTILNNTTPESMMMLLGFQTSLRVDMVSGGAGGPATVVYFHE